MTENGFPRSRFLRRAALAVGGLAGLGAGLRALGGALPPASAAGSARPVDLGPLDAFPEGQFVLATFLSDAAAGEVSRRAAYIRNNGLVDGRPSFTIMSSRCTHVGCPTQPNGPLLPRQQRWSGERQARSGSSRRCPAGFGCPCHGSQFDTEGNRTAGPAPRALDRYEFSIRNGRVWLGKIYSVGSVEGAGATAKIRRFGRLGAGEPATGPESLLYPVDPLS